MFVLFLTPIYTLIYTEMVFVVLLLLQIKCIYSSHKIEFLIIFSKRRILLLLCA